MFRLTMVVMLLCLVLGGAGVNQVGDQEPSMSDSAVKEAQREEETGAITVTIRLPKVISHIDCPPPRRPKE
ncbi:MAG: hypothetical protein ABIH36_01300 [bacterium]